MKLSPTSGLIVFFILFFSCCFLLSRQVCHPFVSQARSPAWCSVNCKPWVLILASALTTCVILALLLNFPVHNSSPPHLVNGDHSTCLVGKYKGLRAMTRADLSGRCMLTIIIVGEGALCIGRKGGTCASSVSFMYSVQVHSGCGT